ncbi:MAG: CBS domain-containing protein [Nitrososphaeraceae archaeon]
MTTKLKTIKEEASVRQAAKKMKEEDVSSLVVVNRDNDNKPVGLVTERDIVRKVCANESIGNIDAIRIVDIISSPLITINSDSSPKQAADVLLQNRIRHLLVIDNRDAVGIITPMDFTRYREQAGKIRHTEEDNVISEIIKYYRD